MYHKIEDLINDKKKLSHRIYDIISVELQRQKDNGKKFISECEIDNLIDEILKNEIHKK